MAERAKLLRIYGDELCAEEAAAVEGMFRMLNYQQHVEALGPAAAADEEESRDAPAVTLSNINAFDLGGGDTGGSTHEYADVFLPPFVRKPLDDMRGAQGDQEMALVIDSFVRLVPDEAKRRFYARIFKWVVAFATWKYVRSSGGRKDSSAHNSGAINPALEQLKRSMAQQTLTTSQSVAAAPAAGGKVGGLLSSSRQTPVKSSTSGPATTPLTTKSQVKDCL